MRRNGQTIKPNDTAFYEQPGNSFSLFEKLTVFTFSTLRFRNLSFNIFIWFSSLFNTPFSIQI